MMNKEEILSVKKVALEDYGFLYLEEMDKNSLLKVMYNTGEVVKLGDGLNDYYYLIDDYLILAKDELLNNVVIYNLKTKHYVDQKKIDDLFNDLLGKTRKRVTI